MKVFITDENREKNNVIYKITCYIGSHYKEYHYIGLTKRPLEKRVYEHITNYKSAVYKFIKENNVEAIHVEVLEQCKYEQLLDSAETRAIANYILKRGTKNNQKNRLINIDLKGLDKYTLKGVKEIYNCLQFN